MKGLLSVILLVVGVVCVSCKPTAKKVKPVGTSVTFKDCGSKLAKVSEVTITPCDYQPCPLIRGKNSTIGVSFKVNDGVPDIVATKAVVHGIIAGIPAPFPIDNNNGCKGCGLTCPLSAGKSYTYTYKLFIQKEFPSVEAIVKWELQSVKGAKVQNADDEVFCIEVEVDVQ